MWQNFTGSLDDTGRMDEYRGKKYMEWNLPRDIGGYAYCELPPNVTCRIEGGPPGIDGMLLVTEHQPAGVKVWDDRMGVALSIKWYEPPKLSREFDLPWMDDEEQPL